MRQWTSETSTTLISAICLMSISVITVKSRLNKVTHAAEILLNEVEGCRPATIM